ncbi:dihydrolipoamide acetyltransferase family protein [Arthrobacter glacialis]|uniref:Dihydrolipoamide acetyltransferase component of pyruvate dehydrogenase complex n=1 Tax=Arthrobacter glacialis TaxID=1664 RepID=A0A2S3ZQZ6_ARTGL|nr:dihydrolipoamide acetyltransferase family protein [Arthrobacter glacialis]POH71656.1 dihydrolipoamide acetyltransferase [Arthrobacter glacialis]
MIEIQMPRLSDTMEEGVINAWLKKPGELVKIGDILVEIETDKAVMEHEAYEAGIFHAVLVQEGQSAPIGTAIALLDDGKDNAPAPVPTGPSTPKAVSVLELATSATPTRHEKPTAGLKETPALAPRTFSSPLARKEAKERGISMGLLTGTGPGGRIVRSDVISATEMDSPATPGDGDKATHGGVKTSDGDSKNGSDVLRGSVIAPFTSVRKVISSRLSESSRTIPHFSLTSVADVEELVQLREEINAQRQAMGRSKISMNDFIVRASALALLEHPGINASYSPENGGQKLLHGRINIGVAMAVEAGLVVPVLVDAAHKPASQLGTETKALTAAAQERKLSPAQLSGGTFTVSNLGMYGVESFSAIINAPEGAILAAGRSGLEVVVRDGEIMARHQLRLTLSADHRIIDGADGAAFLQTLVALLGQPLVIVS